MNEYRYLQNTMTLVLRAIDFLCNFYMITGVLNEYQRV